MQSSRTPARAVRRSAWLVGFAAALVTVSAGAAAAGPPRAFVHSHAVLGTSASLTVVWTTRRRPRGSRKTSSRRSVAWKAS